jgi:hypothetical protein
MDLAKLILEAENQKQIDAILDKKTIKPIEKNDKLDAVLFGKFKTNNASLKKLLSFYAKTEKENDLMCITMFAWERFSVELQKLIKETCNPLITRHVYVRTSLFERYLDVIEPLIYGNLDNKCFFMWFKKSNTTRFVLFTEKLESYNDDKNDISVIPNNIIKIFKKGGT